MLVQRFGSQGRVKSWEHIPVGTFSDVRRQLPLTVKRHRRNIAAVGVLHRGFLATLGNPQQIKRGPHVHLLLNHSAKPGLRFLPVEIRFFQPLNVSGAKWRVIMELTFLPGPNCISSAQKSLYGEIHTCSKPSIPALMTSREWV